jgi:hypothetical protein
VGGFFGFHLLVAEANSHVVVEVLRLLDLSDGLSKGAETLELHALENKEGDDPVPSRRLRALVVG